MQYIIISILFVLIQAMCNRVHIGGFATPFVCIYIAIIAPRSMKRLPRLITCFLVGLAIDMFHNTPGLFAASMTLIGFIQPYVLELFLNTKDTINLIPSIKEMGFAHYLTYSSILISIFCITIFLLETFSLQHLEELALSIIGSAILTIFFILVFELRYIKLK